MIVVRHPAWAVKGRRLRRALIIVITALAFRSVVLQLAHAATLIALLVLLTLEYDKGVNHSWNPPQACKHECDKIGSAPLVNHGKGRKHNSQYFSRQRQLFKF